MVLRGVASGDEHMDESASKLVQTDGEVFADEVSDEEAAASRTTEEITFTFSYNIMYCRFC